MKPDEEHRLREALLPLSRRLEKGVPFLSKESSSDDPEVLHARAYNLYLARKYDEATEIFRTLIAMHPFETRYLFGMAASLQAVKRYDEALKMWGLYTLMDGTDPLPHLHASECYAASGKREEGKKALEAYRRAHPLPDQGDRVRRLETLLSRTG